MDNIRPPNRMSTGHFMPPAERALEARFSSIIEDWPDESKIALRDAIVAALDEAFLAGVAAAKRAANGQ
jgi:hypothetical protein